MIGSLWRKDDKGFTGICYSLKDMFDKQLHMLIEMSKNAFEHLHNVKGVICVKGDGSQGDRAVMR